MERTIRTCDIYGCQNESAERFKGFTVICSDEDTGLRYFDYRDIDICKECEEKILNSGRYVQARIEIDKSHVINIYEINE